MKKLFSTSDVHPRDRFEYWQDVACQTIVGHLSAPACRRTFEARIEVEAVADLDLVLIENSPMAISRTRHHVAQSQDDALFVCRQIAGTFALEQDGRHAMLDAGDVVLLDPLLPYDGKFSSDSKSIVMKVPRRALQARIGNPREMALCPVKASEPEHRWMLLCLEMLSSVAGQMTAAAQQIATDQTLDLFAISVMSAMGKSRPRISSTRSMALLNVRAAIEARLSDRTLDVATVAQAVGVSVRYANALLSEENTSIMRLVQARRLARCRGAFEDPLQEHRTVSEIAYGWGFSDMTHFGRSFKAMYGVLPRDYRKLAKQGVAKPL